MTNEIETMTCVRSFASNDGLSVPAGTEYPSDHWIVRRYGDYFVKAGNKELVDARRWELDRADAQRQERRRAEERDARIAEGTKPLASDDAAVEAYKKLVRESDGLLELVHDQKTGFAIGVKPKASLQARLDALHRGVGG